MSFKPQLELVYGHIRQSCRRRLWKVTFACATTAAAALQGLQLELVYGHSEEATHWISVGHLRPPWTPAWDQYKSAVTWQLIVKFLRAPLAFFCEFWFNSPRATHGVDRQQNIIPRITQVLQFTIRYIGVSGLKLLWNTMKRSWNSLPLTLPLITEAPSYPWPRILHKSSPWSTNHLETSAASPCAVDTVVVNETQRCLFETWSDLVISLVVATIIE